MALQDRTIELLLQTKAVLETGHPEYGFNMGRFYATICSSYPDRSVKLHTCGTAMCIGGWMHYLDGNSRYSIIAMHRREETLNRLFFLRYEDIDCESATSVQAIAAIDQFIATDGEKAWEGIT